MAISSSPLERVYVTKESTYGTAVAPANGDAIRHIKCQMNNETAFLNRRDKTGSRSQTQGQRGRTSAKGSLEMSLVSAGTATLGVPDVPDMDYLLQALMGQASTTGSGKRTYALSDNMISLDVWRYRQPSTLDQQVALGSIITGATFNLGQDIAECSFDYEAKYRLGSSGFGTATTDEKGGLGSFPAEPGSPTTSGEIIAGFTGAFTLNGSVLDVIRTATIKVNTGNELTKDTFNRYYPSGTRGAIRSLTAAFNMYDDDSTALQAIKEAAARKTPVDAVIQIGLSAGNIFVFTLKNLQLADPTLDDSQAQFSLVFADSPAFASTLTSKDEFKIDIQ